MGMQSDTRNAYTILIQIREGKKPLFRPRRLCGNSNELGLN